MMKRPYMVLTGPGLGRGWDPAVLAANTGQGDLSLQALALELSPPICVPLAQDPVWSWGGEGAYVFLKNLYRTARSRPSFLARSRLS